MKAMECFILLEPLDDGLPSSKREGDLELVANEKRIPCEFKYPSLGPGAFLFVPEESLWRVKHYLDDLIKIRGPHAKIFDKETGIMIAGVHTGSHHLEMPT